MRNIAKQAFARRLGPCLGSASAAPAAYPHQSPSERGRLCVASVIYLVLRKPGVGNVHFWASWICIILGVAVTILGSIGGCAPPSVCMPAYSPEVLLAARLQRRRIMMQGFTGEGWSLSQLPRMPWASERLGHLSARAWDVPFSDPKWLVPWHERCPCCAACAGGRGPDAAMRVGAAACRLVDIIESASTYKFYQ